LLRTCDKFLALSPKEQVIFIIGRRTNNFEELMDLENPDLRSRVEAMVNKLGLETPSQAQELVQKIVENFI